MKQPTKLEKFMFINAFDLHNLMEGLFNELVGYFSLKVKMIKPLEILLKMVETHLCHRKILIYL
jgi:hypothetical protein